MIGIGDTSGDGVTVTAEATAAVALRMLHNDFNAISGMGLHLAANGQATFTAAIEGNTLTDTLTDLNSQRDEAAVLVEQNDQAAMHVRLWQNTVIGNPEIPRDAYTLHQRGTGLLSLEGSLSDPTAAITADNAGAPVVVSGTVTRVTPGTFTSELPSVLSGRVWLDQDSDGLQGSGEAGMSQQLVLLAGTESVSGITVSGATLTDGTGGFSFLMAHAGNYTLTLDMPNGYTLTRANQGPDDTLDSDFDPASQQVVAALAAGQDLVFDAGLSAVKWPWQNPQLRADVNNDGWITPLDALVLINDLNANRPRVLPVPPPSSNGPPPYLDVTGDGVVSASDVLVVINILNGAAPSGEGESAGAGPQAIDAVWLAWGAEDESLFQVRSSVANWRILCAGEIAPSLFNRDPTGSASATADVRPSRSPLGRG